MKKSHFVYQAVPEGNKAVIEGLIQGVVKDNDYWRITT